MILAVTGHRPGKCFGYTTDPIQVAITIEMWKTLQRIKPEVVITGMALGVDQTMACVCIAMNIPFVAAVPFKGQERVWSTETQKVYFEILKHAKDVQYISEPGYAAYKLQIRNEWMVDSCDKLLAVWDGSTGGTFNCLKYAQKVGREIIRIDPNNLIGGQGG